MSEYNTHGLVPFSATTAVGMLDRTREIRDAISIAMGTNPKLFSSLSAYLAPQGIAGSVHFDHAIAASIVLENVPVLAKYELNQKQVWGHLLEVLKKRGYRFSGGYIVSHASEEAGVVEEEEPRVQMQPAPEVVTGAYQVQ